MDVTRFGPSAWWKEALKADSQSQYHLMNDSLVARQQAPWQPQWSVPAVSEPTVVRCGWGWELGDGKQGPPVPRLTTGQDTPRVGEMSL